MMASNFPEKLFATPDGWRETYYLTSKQLDEHVEELKSLGLEGDCEEFDLVRQVDENTALYDGEWHFDSYRRNGRRFGYLMRKNGNAFEYVDQFDSSSDYEDEDEE